MTYNKVNMGYNGSLCIMFSSLEIKGRWEGGVKHKLKDKL